MSVDIHQRVVRAAPGDVVPLHRLRGQLEDWLHDKGVQQWPRGEVSQEQVAAQVRRGEWHLVRHPDLGVAAAMRVRWSDPDFWGESDIAAVYVHGLMVARAEAGRGMGAYMLDWAARLGRGQGVYAFRLDCAETNNALRAYYRQQGFAEVGRCDPDGLFSVTLFEKAL